MPTLKHSPILFGSQRISQFCLVHITQTMPPKKRITPFNQEHVIAYGLKVCERDPTTKQIVSVSCRFCVHFGREEKVGAKRKATTNIQYFRCPFRADVYTKHLVSQHSSNWEIYRALSNKKKSTFFEENALVVHRNTLKSYFSGAQIPLHFFVEKDIIEIIVGELLFDADEEDISKVRYGQRCC